MNKLLLIKVLLLVIICFQIVTPCLLFCFDTPPAHHITVSTVNKHKSASVISQVRLRLWSIITKCQCHLPPSTIKLKLLFWLFAGITLFQLSALRLRLFSLLRYGKSFLLYNTFKWPLYLLFGQFTI